MGKGQSFLSEFDTTSRGKLRHLNVVISNPDSENNVLVVPVCTYYENNGRPLPMQDDSCVLPADCHPFTKHKSFVLYSRARAVNLVAIFNDLQKGRIIRKEDFSDVYVQNMQRGAELMRKLPSKLKRFFEFFL